MTCDCNCPYCQVGPRGKRGMTGKQGPAGVKGDRGPQGLNGEKGERGPQGLKGDKGEIGSQGPKGERGPRGFQGPPGPPGSSTSYHSLSARMLVNYSTELVPPAKVGSTFVKKELQAEITSVCDEVVVISGFIRIYLKYEAIDASKKEMVDEVPFSSIIDRDDIRKEDEYKIIEEKILCEVEQKEASLGFDQKAELDTVHKLSIKDVVKIRIKKVS